MELIKLCQFVSGGTPSKNIDEYFTGTVPWISGADISNDKITKPRHYITEEAIQNSATNRIPAGNILLVTRTGVGKVAINDYDICISQDFTGLIPDRKKVDVQYLYRYLQSQKGYFVQNQRGATIQGITRDIVENLDVPLPYPEDSPRSLETQRRIVARLEALLAEVASARGLQDEIVRDTEQVMDATRHELFTELAKRVSIKKFDEIADSRLGKMLSTVSKTGKYYRPYLRNANVLWDAFDLSDVSEMDFEPDKRERYALRPGDVLICEGGDIGRSAVWEGQIPECYYQKALHRVRLRDEQALPRYLMHYMAWSSKNGAIAQLKTGAAIPHLTGASLSTLDVVWPDPIEQKKVVIHLDTVSDEIKAMQMENKENSLLLTQLEQSFLAQAFRGEL